MKIRDRMNFRRIGRAMTLATVSAGALITTQAMAQDTQAQDEAETAEPSQDQILVVGIRGSVDSANAKKRNAKQIVDSVVSEDVGKLPDNNVPEALSRVTGVQIDRVHGEGSSVTIRGLSDVQTTINGNEAGVAGSRSLNLADIPAELLKSVDVYKTRSADQPEGGIAGTVNIELRRPLDLKKGLTVAGSFRETFSDIGNTKSPYASLLLAERFDTPIGEMGFLLNGSLTNNKYNENFVAAESPGQIGFFTDSPSNTSVPVALRDTLVPYAVTYGVESGSIKRPSLNASWQWRASPKLDFVLEGSYLGARQTAVSDYLKLQTNTDQGSYSNLVVDENGTIQSLTLNNPNGVPGGPLSLYQKTRTDTYSTNFVTNWASGNVHITFSNQYNWSDTNYYFVQQQSRIAGATSVDVDFNSDNVPGGGPYITFPNNSLNTLADYRLYQVHDQNGGNNDTFFASNLDFTVDTGKGLLRSVQFGARFTKRTMGYTYGYRDAFYFNTATAPSMEAVAAATGNGFVTSTPDIRDGQVPSWYHFDNARYYDNFGAMRDYVMANGADLLGNDWNPEQPGNNDPGSSYRETERTFAAYGILNWGLDAPFPIDGTIGLRYVNTWGTAQSTQNYFDVVNGVIDYTVLHRLTSSKGNYTDMLPSATVNLHFTPKLQLRLSYTHNVQRPSFYDLRTFKELRDAIINPTNPVYAGNPDLKPIQENNFDASLEHYFTGGMVSLGAFLKNQNGFIYYTLPKIGDVDAYEYIPELGGRYRVGKPRNAGPGKIFGFELQGNTMFSFLPGFARNFGVNANFTYIPVSRLELYRDDNTPDVPGVFDAPYTSKYTGNVALFYDTPTFSARVAYNVRSKFKTYIDYVNPGYSVYMKATSRLDAAINVTPVKFMTLSLEATNILRNNANTYFGAYDSLPVGVREQARTVQASARFRF
jgi:iron complex outermembrane receptor protein